MQWTPLNLNLFAAKWKNKQDWASRRNNIGGKCMRKDKAILAFLSCVQWEQQADVTVSFGCNFSHHQTCTSVVLLLRIFKKKFNCLCKCVALIHWMLSLNSFWELQSITVITVIWYGEVTGRFYCPTRKAFKNDTPAKLSWLFLLLSLAVTIIYFSYWLIHQSFFPYYLRWL